MKLRDYQQDELVTPLVNFLCEEEGDPLVAAPTGVGKSLGIAGFIKQVIDIDPQARFLIGAHTKEIVSQNASKMLQYWPKAPVGVYSAGLGRYDTQQQVIYAGIQSVYKKASLIGHVDCLVCDEAHTLSPSETTRWQTLITGLRKINPRMRLTGFSATPFRSGMGTLVEGGLFTKMVVDLTTTARINQFVAEGYLAPLVSKKPSQEIDISGVRMTAGEFNQGDLEMVTDKDELNRSVVLDSIKWGADRNHWLVFATSKTHAENLAQMYRSKGITCEILTDSDSDETRARLIGDESKGIVGEFQKGYFRALINVGILTTGFDFPALDLIVLVRATQSVVLYIQMLGRGTRPFPGKKNTLILDYGGNIRRLGPFNDPILPRARKKGDSGEGEAPVKACPVCGTYCHTRVTVCPDCLHEFPASSCIERVASQSAVMVESGATPVIEIMENPRVFYKDIPCKNEAWGKGIQVAYTTMGMEVREHFFPNSTEAFVVRQYQSWWKAAGGSTPVPSTAEDATERARKELRNPAAIHFVSNTKYKKVKHRVYPQSVVA